MSHMMIFSIDDGHGNQLTTGLQGYDAAFAVATRIVGERGEAVLMYSGAFSEHVRPVIPVTVTASDAGPSSCVDIAGAVDVSVVVTLGRVTVDGDVTLAPAQHDGQLAPYGTTTDQWISGALLRALYDACELATGALPGGRPRDPGSVLAAANAWFRAALEEIERAAVAAAQEVV